jgi:hypothetical protein
MEVSQSMPWPWGTAQVREHLSQLFGRPITDTWINGYLRDRPGLAPQVVQGRRRWSRANVEAIKKGLAARSVRRQDTGSQS